MWVFQINRDEEILSDFRLREMAHSNVKLAFFFSSFPENGFGHSRFSPDSDNIFKMPSILLIYCNAFILFLIRLLCRLPGDISCTTKKTVLLLPVSSLRKQLQCSFPPNNNVQLLHKYMHNYVLKLILQML